MNNRLSKLALFVASCLAFVGANAEDIARTFNDLGTPKTPLRLGGTQASYTIKVPAAPRENVTGATLHLESVNSTALIKSRSELNVRVNGTIIGQYPLDPVNTKNSVDIPIPANYLSTGYNDLSVGVVQHYTYDCEDDGSPELWTEIDPVRSYVTYNVAGQRANNNPKLTQLDLAFDKRGWLPKTLVVVFAEDNVTAEELNAASLAVQGLSLRMGYRPLNIEVATKQSVLAATPQQSSNFPYLNQAAIAGKDVLIVGDLSKVTTLISDQNRVVIEKAKGPFVGVFPEMQGDSVVTVISNSAPDVKKGLIWAAKSIANPNYKFSDASVAEAILKEPELPKNYVAKVKADEYFSSFGYKTTYSRGLKIQPINFEFIAPADYGARNGDKVRIVLHFSYGAGIRKDSSMNVMLNGQFATAVPLNQEKGGEFNNFELKLPAEFVKPGLNVITFEPVFLTYKDRCDMHRDEHLLLTVFEDSTIQLPKETVAVKIPDLKRMAQGFWPYHEKIQIVQTSQNGQLAAGVLNLVAMLSQKNRVAFDVDVQPNFATGPVFVVGTEETTSTVNGGGSGLEQTAWAKKLNAFNKYSWVARGNHAGIFQASGENGSPITVFWADNTQTLNKAVFALGRKGLWDSMQGQAAIIDTQNGLMSIDMPDSQREVRESEKFLTQYGIVSANYMLYGIILGIALFAVAFVAILRNRAARRQRELQEQDTVIDN